MNVTELPQVLQQAIGVWEGLKRLGFKGQQVYMISARVKEDDRVEIAIQIEAQDRKCAIGIGMLKGVTSEEVAHKWAEILTAIQKGDLSETALKACWLNSPPYLDKVRFEASIRGCGIIFPKDLN